MVPFQGQHSFIFGLCSICANERRIEVVSGAKPQPLPACCNRFGFVGGNLSRIIHENILLKRYKYKSLMYIYLYIYIDIFRTNLQKNTLQESMIASWKMDFSKMCCLLKFIYMPLTWFWAFGVWQGWRVSWRLSIAWWTNPFRGDRISATSYLLMVQKSGHHHLGCIA